MHAVALFFDLMLNRKRKKKCEKFNGDPTVMWKKKLRFKSKSVVKSLDFAEK